MMRVGELKKILETIPDNFEIILSRDAEGNGYGMVSLLTQRIAHSKTTYEIELIDEDEATNEPNNCIVLYP